MMYMYSLPNVPFTTVPTGTKAVEELLVMSGTTLGVMKVSAAIVVSPFVYRYN
jgi:hypothetical protein